MKMPLVLNWLESLDMDIRVTDACVRQSNLHSSCTACCDKCTHKAIAINGKNVRIDAAKCNSCGDCLIACPPSALEGIGTSRVFEDGVLLYDDAYTPSVKELLINKKRGMNAIRTKEGHLNGKWEEAVNQTNSLLAVLNESPIKINNRDIDKTLSRRDFFASFRKEGKQLAKKMAPASWKMNKNGWKLSSYFPDVQFYSVNLNPQKCDLCGLCFSFCQEGVFSAGETGIAIANEKCVNCASCIDVCPHTAIQIEADFRGKSERIVDFYSRTCKICRQEFSSFHDDEEFCHVCKDRDPSWLSPY
jgi:Fe-S-cluster-containing hydrogenase component 2